MNGKVFGYMPDGRPVHQYEIRNERMVVRVAELGATLVSCAIDGRDVALGYDTAEEYLNNVGNMGATVGRYANRILPSMGEHINSPAIARRTAFMAAKSVFTKSYGA